MTSTSQHAVQVALRRASLKGVRLAVPIDVFPGEGMADVLFRASAMNGFQSSSVMSTMLGLDPATRITHYLLSKLSLDYASVADVLGTPNGEEDLSHLAYAADATRPEGVQFFGTTIRRRSLSADVRRISPSSLGTVPHQQAVWCLRILSFDPSTKELLLDRCPKCQRRLEFRQTRSVESCGFCITDGEPTDLRWYPQPRLEVEDVEALNFFTSLILPQKDHCDLGSKVSTELSSFGRGQLFELISSIAVALDFEAAGDRRVAFYRQPSIETIILVSRAILEWPQGMRRLMMSILPRQKGVHRYPLRGISKIAFFDESLRALIRREAEASIGERVFRAIDGSQAGLERDVARKFRDPKDELMRLSRLVSRPNGMIRGSEIDLGTALRASTSIRKLSESIGLPVPLLVGLYTANLLPISEPGLEPHFHRPEEPPTVTLEDRIHELTSSDCASKNASCLWDAVIAFDQMNGNPWPNVFSAILAGELLVAYRVRIGAPLVRRLVLTDLTTLDRVVSNPDPIGSMQTASLKRAELPPLFGLYKLRDVGEELKAVFAAAANLEDVWKLRRQYLCRKDVVILLKATGRIQHEWALSEFLAEAGIEKCNSGTSPIYCRRQIEALVGR